MADPAIGYWGVPLAVLGGAVRVSTPFLFVSLGECITERSGRINLGLEGTLVLGAMCGTGLPFYLAKPLIEPSAPIRPSIDFGWWSEVPQVRAVLRINVLFIIGVALAPLLVWGLRTTRWGLILRTAGESADAARAMGYSVNLIRLRATILGGF